MMLAAKHVTKSFRRDRKSPLLNGIDLEVKAGESIAITGPSGVGKSTLLHILGTLELPTSGELYICGEKVTPRNRSQIRNRKIGFIFQAFHLLEELTVLENVLMPAKISRNVTHESINYAHALIAHVGLTERAHFLAKKLSGGEKQRVAIARALLMNPDIIFADEPTGNLDQDHAKVIHELLLHPVQEQKKSLVVVTHNRNLAMLCKKNYILDRGKLIKESSCSLALSV